MFVVRCIAIAVFFLTILPVGSKTSQYTLRGRPGIQLRAGRTLVVAGFHRKRALHQLLSEAGPVFIKLGQWLTTRPDMLSEEQLRDLAHLQDRVPHHSLAYTEQVLRREFGPDHRSTVALSTSKPIGSGSLAQVYLAKFRGQDCVVKVLHPSIHQKVMADISLINHLLRVGYFDQRVRKFGETFDLDNFYASIIEQIDLRNEAKAMVRMGKNFDENKNVVIPEFMYSSEDILIESRVCGATMDRFALAHPAHAQEAHTLMGWVVRKMILVDNYIHQDMHQGNVLFYLDQGVVNMSLIDFGLVGSLDEETLGLGRQFLRFVFFPNLSAERELLETFNTNPACADELKGVLDEHFSSPFDPYATLMTENMDLKQFVNAPIQTLIHLANRCPMTGHDQSFGNLFEKMNQIGVKINMFKLATFLMFDGLEHQGFRGDTALSYFLFVQQKLKFGIANGFYDIEKNRFVDKRLAAPRSLDWTDKRQVTPPSDRC